MKRTNNFIPTLIALTVACIASQSLQAQAPARQAFPWSSSSVSGVAETVSRASSAVQTITQAPSPASSGSASRSIIGNTTSIANNVLSAGDPIYLDENGNQITREQMQAKLSSGQNEVSSALGSASEAVQSFGQNLGQNFQQHVTPLQSVDNSAWGKAKSVTSKATSFWKKPAWFGSTEGITLPSVKSTWAKPKFQQPTTWFSKKAQDPINFATIGSLPRQGQFPTSTDGPLHAPQQIASRVVESVTPNPSSKPASFSPDASVATDALQSVFEAPKDRIASGFNSGGDFSPR